MQRSRKSAAPRFALLAIIALAACQDASQPTAPISVPQAPQAARSPVAQARLEAIFQRTSAEVMALPGTVFADNDEAVGKVVFGVENAAAMNGVRHALARFGIDESDYAIEVTKPIVMAATLRDRFQSKQGGIQIHFTRYLCTLGFNVTVNNQASFITNSHCTATQGGVESTVYYQPTSSVDRTVIATEVDDPLYSKGVLPGCPRNKKCRYSDAARAAYSAGTNWSLGVIAKTTTGPNTGDLTVNGSFSISGVGTVKVDDEVNKVGRTTGWTRGTVDRTCVNTSVSGSTVYLLCQTFVSDPGGATVVGSGDSGSAVFGNASSAGVPLLGILWGGSSDNKMFVFSPFAQIEQELSGTLVVK